MSAIAPLTAGSTRGSETGMIGTIARQVAVSVLDAVVERGRRSSRRPVRIAAKALGRLRGAAGLETVGMRSPKPQWRPQQAEQPMWDSDRRKLEKWRVDHGIPTAPANGSDAKTSGSAEAVELAEELRAAQASAHTSDDSEARIKLFGTRGCVHARAAEDLLRERELAFESVDVSDDASLRNWLKLVTGRTTTPQIFIDGKHVGGYDELCELDCEGSLVDVARGPVRGGVGDVRPPRRLPVFHPERSPFAYLQTSNVVPPSDGERLDPDTLLATVREVLDECRPLVQSDGGDIELLDIRDDVVHLQLTGNCVGCPSSQVTLRQGIERRLKARIPQIRGLATPQATTQA